MISTPEQIETFRLMTLRTALKLEIKGLKRRGKSAYSILKAMGFSGNKESVLVQVQDEIDHRKSQMVWEGLGF